MKETFTYKEGVDQPIQEILPEYVDDIGFTMSFFIALHGTSIVQREERTESWSPDEEREDIEMTEDLFRVCQYFGSIWTDLADRFRPGLNHADLVETYVDEMRSLSGLADVGFNESRYDIDVAFAGCLPRVSRGLFVIAMMAAMCLSGVKTIPGYEHWPLHFAPRVMLVVTHIFERFGWSVNFQLSETTPQESFAFSLN